MNISKIHGVQLAEGVIRRRRRRWSSALEIRRKEEQNRTSRTVDSAESSRLAIILLQFELHFRVLVLLGAYLSVCCSLIDAAHAVGLTEEFPKQYTGTVMSFLYFLDLMYLIDIISMIAYKHVKWNEIRHLYRTRHKLLIVVEIIAIIPFDFFYYTLSKSLSMVVLYMLRLRYTLRIARLVFEVVQMRMTVGHSAIFVAFLDFFLVVSVVLVLGTCSTFLCICLKKRCVTSDQEFLKQLLVVAGKITARGYFTENNVPFIVYWIYIIIAFGMYFYIRAFTVGNVTCATKQRIFPIALFSSRLAEIQTRFNKTFKKDPVLERTVTEYYSTFWQNRRGLRTVDVSKILPEVLLTEMGLDLSWHALKHSHLFRDEDMAFLHHVSVHFKHSFMVAGEIIIKKGEVKERMVYLSSGIIQIYSQEDGETPIMTLGAGTCLGESSLIISYRSSCTVVCLTYCELDILERADFVKIIAKYPEYYKKLRRSVYKRYDEAREFIRIKAYQNVHARSFTTERYKSMSLKWIKLTLKRLFSKEDHFFESYIQRLGTEERLLVLTVTKMLYCAKYLDLLVLSETGELAMDVIFARTSCPCILRPNSVLVKWWEKFISITVLCYAFICPFQISFTEGYGSVNAAIVWAVTIIWWLDVYIKSYTAVMNKGEIVMDVNKILMKRFTEVQYVLDVLAAVPIEVITYMTRGYIENEIWKLLQVNRMLKITRINSMFRTYEHSITHNFVFVKYAKYVTYGLLIVCWVAAVLHSLVTMYHLDEVNLFNKLLNWFDLSDIFDNIMLYLYTGVHMLTSLAYRIGNESQADETYVSLVVVQILITAGYVLFVSDMASAHTMKGYRMLVAQEYMKTINFIMEDLKFSAEYKNSVRRYIVHQWQVARGAIFLYPNSVAFDLPKELFSIVRYENFCQILAVVPFFQDIPKALMARICCNANIINIPAGQIMTYAREVSNQMYIIDKGYCDVISADGAMKRIIGPGDSIAVLETVLNRPVINTTITRTSCDLISVAYDKFREAVCIDPAWVSELDALLKSYTEWSNLEDKMMDKNTKKTVVAEERTSTPSFRNFGYRLASGSEAYNDYFEPFERLGSWKFVRFFLMRHTISTDGKFLRYWEISRCIFALLSVIFFSIPPINVCRYCIWYYVTWVLDISAWIDIYVRHHVSYYNQDGIEVYHPWKTAVYYWKNSFIIDLMGSVPAVSIINYYMSHKKLPFLKLNRFLQIYRVVKAFDLKMDDISSSIRSWSPLLYFIVTYVLISYTTLYALWDSCNFGDHLEASELYTEGVRCSNLSFLSKSLLKKPLTPIKTYLYATFTVTNILLNNATMGTDISSKLGVLMVMVHSFFGFFIIEVMCAKTIAINMSRNVDLTNYQEKMRALMYFLTYKRIDSKLKDELIEHFEYIWSKEKGKKYEVNFSYFNNALKEDVMYNIFGRTMEESTIFKGASTSFFRSLLLKTRHVIIIRRGIISRVNDVHGIIYFIYKGQVEVLGPDYNRLLILPVGSMFGNLDEVEYGRRTLTMVAKGHVELLMIETSDFYKVLNNYILLKVHFKRLTLMNQDYLVGGPLPKIERTLRRESSVRKPANLISEQSSRIKLFLLGVHERTTSVRAWELTVLIIVCFLGSSVEMYRITMRDRSPVTTAFVYFCDLLHLLKIYFMFHISYEDHLGMAITDPKMVAKHYIKTGFCLDIISLLPLEMFCLAAWNYPGIFWYIFILGRITKLLRLVYLFKFLHVQNSRVSANVFLIRTLHFFVFVVIFMQFVTASLIIVGCLSEVNMHPPMKCNMDEMTTSDKIFSYVDVMSIVMSIFTLSPSVNYYPEAAHMMVLMIMLLLISRFMTMIFIAETCATLEVVLHRKTMYEQRIGDFKQHMQVLGVSRVIAEKTWRYMKLLWDKNRGLQFPDLLEEVPYYLKEAVLNSMFGFHIRNHPVLRACHMDLIRQMAARLRTRTFFYGDIIAFQGEIDETMYFIQEGEVNVLSENTQYKEVVDHTLGANETFGLEQGMYPRVGHEFTYKAADYTILVQLQRKDWIHLLDFFPASKELIYDEKCARMDQEF